MLAARTNWLLANSLAVDYAGAAEKYSREFSNFLILDYQELVDERAGREQLERFLGVEFDVEAYQRVLGHRHKAHHRALPESSVVTERMRALFQS